MPTMLEIRERLVTARKRAGLSQTQVARMLGLSTASSFSDIESGRNPLTMDRFLRLCEIYDINETWAITGANPEFDAEGILKAAGRADDEIMEIIDLLQSLRQEKGGKE
jgi:transcriptional regulator with XRE-family HTH domain